MTLLSIRRRSRASAAALLGLAGALLFSSGSAHAAPQAACVPATISPAGKTIPVNFPGWSYDVVAATSNDVHLVAAKGGGELALTLSAPQGGVIKVTPTNPLTAGDSYTLTFSSFCDYGGTAAQSPITFTAVAESPIPTMLGTLVGTPAWRTQDFGTTEVTLDVSYTLAPEMKPWLDGYAFAVTLNGREIESHPTLTAAGDGISVHAVGWCEAADGKNAKQQLALTAKLPFSPTLTSAVTELPFACPAPKVGPLAGDPATAPDGGAATTTTTTTPGTKGGCSAAGADAGSWLSGAGMLVGLVAITRRRVAAKKGARS